jgi:hypothetical protein
VHAHSSVEQLTLARIDLRRMFRILGQQAAL